MPDIKYEVTITLEEAVELRRLVPEGTIEDDDLPVPLNDYGSLGEITRGVIRLFIQTSEVRKN